MKDLQNVTIFKIIERDWRVSINAAVFCLECLNILVITFYREDNFRLTIGLKLLSGSNYYLA